ncbi:MAG: hypothetical protein U9N77_09555 [Thermodesulfobacteriota bacterium]|nr:hypothetical protein [Thermodesulfobacteriota bacterium]
MTVHKNFANTRLSSFLNTTVPSGCLSGTRTMEDFFPARLKIGDLRPLVLKQLDCRNAWQGKSLISFGSGSYCVSGPFEAELCEPFEFVEILRY